MGGEKGGKVHGMWKCGVGFFRGGGGGGGEREKVRQKERSE